jgi:alpha-L-fucosidase
MTGALAICLPRSTQPTNLAMKKSKQPKTSINRPQPHGPVPSPRQLAWHRRERYGFVHFSPNTFSDREWGYGDEAPSIFNPEQLDCRQWVHAAKAGGLTGLILTAKHHDGFCLWPTKATKHSVASSPFRGGKGDIVRELSEACAEGGIGFGVYCSPWDRNNAEYARPGYVKAFYQQMKELLTGYGPMFELWFDGANGGDGYYGGAREKRSIDRGTYYRYDDLWALCRKHQPDAAIFSDAPTDVRWCGNEAGYTNFTCWSKVRPEGFEAGVDWDFRRLISGDADGTVWRPAEVDVSMRPGWFWHPTEQPKTGDELFDIWLASVGRGACLNLNLSPDRRGLIGNEDVAALAAFQARVASFTAVDLAAGCKKVTAGKTASGDPLHLVDGKRDTWWEAAEQTSEVTIEFGRDERMGGIRIEEAIQYGQRVSSFAVDIRRWKSWYEWTRGTTIGAQRIFELGAAYGDAVRVRILESQAPAVLANIHVYGR